MKKNSRPNIIIFMMDTQGARNMGCYGYYRPTTPNIDLLAREGAVFLNHFVTGPWTLPTHASLFSGRYESGHGAGAQHEVLEPGIPMMGEIFGRAGYHTAAFCNNIWAYDPEPGGTSWGFKDYIRYNDLEAVEPFVPSDNPDERDKGALKAVGLMLQWIDRHRARRAEQPFLIFVNSVEPHDVYRPPEPFRSRFLPPGVQYDPDVHAPHGLQARVTVGEFTPPLDFWFIQRALYDASTATLDDRIGLFTRELRQRGILDDTIFIVTGDHGDTIGEHPGHCYHNQNGVWDTIMKTPLVVRYPRLIKPGARCKNLTQIVDVLPTLMDICGVEDPAARQSIQGENFVTALKKPVRDFALLEAQRSIHPIRRAWSETANPEEIDVRFMNVWYKAARTQRHKYVWVSNGQDMLFDIVKDPDERWNVIDRHPEIARKLQQAMERKLMSMEQRYYMDAMRPEHRAYSRRNPYQVRRMAAWGFYQPGVVPPWDPRELERWLKEGGAKKK